jgi:hypothetical protein
MALDGSKDQMETKWIPVSRQRFRKRLDVSTVPWSTSSSSGGPKYAYTQIRRNVIQTDSDVFLGKTSVAEKRVPRHMTCKIGDASMKKMSRLTFRLNWLFALAMELRALRGAKALAYLTFSADLVYFEA